MTGEAAREAARRYSETGSRKAGLRFADLLDREDTKKSHELALKIREDLEGHVKVKAYSYFRAVKASDGSIQLKRIFVKAHRRRKPNE